MSPLFLKIQQNKFHKHEKAETQITYLCYNLLMNEWIYSFIITIDFAKSKAWMETEDNNLLMFEILIAEKYSF